MRLAEIKRAGYALAVYTVNDPAQAAQLREIGVDYIFSDVPDVILST